jgi:uroporphyrinogen decarboxylase
MTGLKRVLMALALKKPDGVPTLDYIGSRVVTGILPNATEADLVEFLDLDGIYIDDLTHSWPYETVDESKKIMKHPFGGLVQYLSDDCPAPISPAIQSVEELSRYRPPDPDAPELYVHLEKMVKRFKGKKAIIASIQDIFGLCKNFVLGDVPYYMSIHDNPQFIEDVNHVLLDYQLAYMKNCIDMGADVVLLGGDWAMGQGPLISPEHLARFAAPSLKEMVEYAHSRGIPVIKHTDGNVWPIVDMLLDTGIDGLNPIDPMGGMDMGDAKSRIGDKVCLCGNIDCAHLLVEGTEVAVREAVRECISKGAEGGGFICMSSNSIHNGVKPENYVTMVNAVKAFGQY